MITFAFRQDPSYWSLDDISVKDTTSGAELVQNGGFENSTFPSFLYCNIGGDIGTFKNPSGSSFAHTGLYSFVDYTEYWPDYISQMLNMTVGHVYNVTFWLQNGGGPPNSFLFIMSI
jgi:hypothetical protein